MNQIVDFSIIGVFIVFITYIAVRPRKYVRSVADFLVANRCAGRYLICVAEGEAAMGAISVIYFWENYLNAGWTMNFWNAVSVPVMLLVTVTGWIVYRFRATRAMTLAQFFEMRYSKKFRIFTGIVCWASGVLNLGIFPGVAARFFISWFGWHSYCRSFAFLR